MNLSKICRKGTEKICAYCEYSSSEINETHILCKKKGAVLKTSTCFRYKYNPLKRIPPKRVRVKTPFSGLDL